MILSEKHYCTLMFTFISFAYSYRVAQSAVLEAIPKLHDLGIPTKRPNDYFAEMIKSDAHMTKVTFF